MQVGECVNVIHLKDKWNTWFPTQEVDPEDVFSAHCHDVDHWVSGLQNYYMSNFRQKEEKYLFSMSTQKPR